jgi:hypothetical protein
MIMMNTIAEIKKNIEIMIMRNKGIIIEMMTDIIGKRINRMIDIETETEIEIETETETETDSLKMIITEMIWLISQNIMIDMIRVKLNFQEMIINLNKAIQKIKIRIKIPNLLKSKKRISKLLFLQMRIKSLKSFITKIKS